MEHGKNPRGKAMICSPRCKCCGDFRAKTQLGFLGHDKAVSLYTAGSVNSGSYGNCQWRSVLRRKGSIKSPVEHCVKLCTAKLCLENQNKTYRDQSYPKAFPQINKRESNFPCSLAQITPDNKQRFNTHSVSLARA